MTDTYKVLEDSCKSIANEIENGIIVTKGNIDYYSEYEVGDEINANTYLENNMGIDITYSYGDGTYRSTKILVAFGGPNIYIETNPYNNDIEIKGYWGCDRVSIVCKDNMGIDSYAEDLHDITIIHN